MNIRRYKLIAFIIIGIIFGGLIVPLQATAPLKPNSESSPTTLPIPEAAFDQRMSMLMRLAGFSALSTCIIQDDQITWSNGYGYYDRAEKKKATIDTIYILASVTKTVVGTALMQLYEQGLCALDDDVNLYLPFELRNPNFPDDPITIRMLLSHTSSLNTNNQLQYYWLNFSGDPPFDFFPDPYLKEFLVPGGRYYDSTVWSTTYRPGENAMYANVGFDLISYLVQLISGEPFLDYCDAHIFTPLEMYNTSFNLSRLPIDQVAIPYQRFAGRYYMINQLTFIYKENTPPEKNWRGRFYPAGGLYSTVSDLSHFLIAHMNEGVYHGTRILEKETVALMHTIQPNNTIGYGLAWMQTIVNPRLVATGHAGDLPGTDTWMLYNQTQDIGIIYFANGNPGYSLLLFGGYFSVSAILNSLFTKQGNLGENTNREIPLISPLFFHQPLMTPRSLRNQR